MATRPASHSKTPAKKPAAAAKPSSTSKPSKNDKHDKVSAKSGPSSKHAPPPSKHDKAAPKSVKISGDKPVARDRGERATIGREEPMTMPKMAAATPLAPESDERPVLVQTTMNKTQLARFRKLLEDKRDDIIKKAKQTLDEDMALDANDLPDEMDLASSEYLQSFTFRLRGREKSFLDKIEKALKKIEDGSFGVCEECGEEISVKRLEARPETTLCIRCKEDQERAEKDYG